MKNFKDLLSTTRNTFGDSAMHVKLSQLYLHGTSTMCILHAYEEHQNRFSIALKNTESQINNSEQFMIIFDGVLVFDSEDLVAQRDELRSNLDEITSKIKELKTKISQYDFEKAHQLIMENGSLNSLFGKRETKLQENVLACFPPVKENA